MIVARFLICTNCGSAYTHHHHQQPAVFVQLGCMDCRQMHSGTLPALWACKHLRLGPEVHPKPTTTTATLSWNVQRASGIAHLPSVSPRRSRFSIHCSPCSQQSAGSGKSTGETWLIACTNNSQAFLAEQANSQRGSVYADGITHTHRSLTISNNASCPVVFHGP